MMLVFLAYAALVTGSHHQQNDEDGDRDDDRDRVDVALRSA